MPDARTLGLMLKTVATVAARRMRRGPRRAAWPLTYEVLSDFMRANMEHVVSLDPPGQRAANESLVPPSPALRSISRQSVDAGGVPAEWFVPKQLADESSPVLLYLHGGSYVFGSTRTHGDLIARLCLSAQSRALGLNYRLAPEHPFPAALDDTLAAYRWLLASGVAASRIVIAGDSAGGGLAVAALLAMRDRAIPLPAGAALIAPWVDLECNGASMTTNEPFDWGTRAMLLKWAAWYASATPIDDPLVSPVHADLRGLPPLLIHLGGAELQLDDVTRFAEKARADGVDVTFRVWPDLFHNFHTFHPYVREAAEAVAEIGAFVRGRSG